MKGGRFRWEKGREKEKEKGQMGTIMKLLTRLLQQELIKLSFVTGK